MYEELKRIDLAALERQTRGVPGGDRATPTRPLRRARSCARQLGLGFDELRRSDLPYFFRAPAFDDAFPAERLVAAFEPTLAGLGIDLDAQPNVHLDTEQRPPKSPRAFCAPVRVPDEVYLVIPRVGGRDDYAALFHEGGHTEHYAQRRASLPFEFRHLGDNSVTECFAFLFEHLTSRTRPGCAAVLGVARPGRRSRLTRAPRKLVSCAATRRSSPTSWSCTAASAAGRDAGALRRPAGRRDRGSTWPRVT